MVSDIYAGVGEKVSGQISYNDYYAGIDNGNPSYIIKGSGSKIHSTRVGLGHIWEISKNFKNSTTVFYSSINQDRIADKAFEVSSSPNVGFRTTFQHSYTWRNFSNQLDFGAEVQNSHSQISNYRFTGTNPNNPLEMSPISKGSYFKYNNNQSNYFAIERLTYKPWNFTFLAGVSLNRINYDREDLLAFGGLVPGYNKDLSFSKDYKMVSTPHFAVQKRWKNQIFNLSYSEGYNAPTASTSFVSGIRTCFLMMTESSIFTGDAIT
jgi:iron complex outermembrane receptor protein